MPPLTSNRVASSLSGGRQCRLPLARAAFIPSRVRSAMKRRSNWARRAPEDMTVRRQPTRSRAPVPVTLRDGFEAGQIGHDATTAPLPQARAALRVPRMLLSVRFGDSAMIPTALFRLKANWTFSASPWSRWRMVSEPLQKIPARDVIFRNLAPEDSAWVPVGAAWKPDALTASITSRFVDILAQTCAGGNGGGVPLRIVV